MPKTKITAIHKLTTACGSIFCNRNRRTMRILLCSLSTIIAFYCVTNSGILSSTTRSAHPRIARATPLLPNNVELAVCVTGELNRLSQSLPQVYPLLEALDPNYKLYIYISLFRRKIPKPDFEYLKNLTLHNSHVAKSISYNDTLVPMPKLKFVKLKKDPPPLQGIMQQIHAQKVCMEMVLNSTNVYKFMLRLRSDHFVQNMKSALANLNVTKNWIREGYLVVPDPMYDAKTGLNDRMAIGNMKVMQLYMMRYDDLFNGRHPRKTTYNAEDFLKETVISHKIEVKRNNWKDREVRH